ncbi:DUF2975 domain-containing protein [Companilactobacillus furfuricola]|uniref:DUF2975 domain-containing protein n=1 Tax=Companilactobacillus furfuricola TaxID=1462575 RepID=UPI0013DDD465|nr:DUF2975 domain-containing protein [Companilactobacillus furfuricola]
MKINTTFLKIVTAILDLFVLFFVFILGWGVISSIIKGSVFKLQLITAGFLFIGALIVFVISYYLFKVFHLMDKQQFFTQTSLHAVKMIRNLFIGEFVDLLGIMPFVYYLADDGDAPGIIIIVGAVVFLPLAISAFISAMQQILIKAINMKAENDLTI